MYLGLLHLHVLTVILFLLIHLIKTTVLLLNKHDFLDKINKILKIPHIVISSLFLLSGVYLLFNAGSVREGTWIYIKVLIILAAIPLAVVGIKRKNKLLSVISLLLFIYVYGVSETKSSIMKPVKPVISIQSSEDKQTAGKLIYEKVCINCHGADGTSGLSGAANLAASKLDKEEVKDLIRNGKKNMIAYKEILAEEEIEAVADYVNSLRNQ